MRHKYLEEITNIAETPYRWCSDTGRDEKWINERKIYGFDERETWSLDYTFFCWLYERCMMFKEINCVDLDFHKFNINGKMLTQGECIDKIINNCKRIITYKGIDDLFVLKNEVLEIWKECIYSMWW